MNRLAIQTDRQSGGSLPSVMWKAMRSICHIALNRSDMVFGSGHSRNSNT
jgi:hypothetical protein